MIKHLAAAGAAAGVVALGVFTFSGTANATSPTPTPSASTKANCKNVQSTLKDRPDSGNHGTWATDTALRTVQTCVVSRNRDGSWNYKASVNDTGSFVTVPGASNSPNKGDKVIAIDGVFSGSFTATFTASADWHGYIGDTFENKTYTGDGSSAGNHTTSAWVQAMWTAKNWKSGNSIDNDWWWMYTTCHYITLHAQNWTDNYKTNGAGPDDGDITGTGGCASPPLPRPSKSATPSPSPSASHSATPVASVSTSASGSPSLPVTGSNTGMIAGIGAGGVALGGVALFAARRRKGVRFTA